MKTLIAAIFLAAAAVAFSACSNSDASEFAGTWKVADTGGKPFEITLTADGTAKANRAGEGMNGSWKKDGSSAVIKWDTGWTTKITKEGDRFTKVAYDKGGSEPKGTSPAEKVK